MNPDTNQLQDFEALLRDTLRAEQAGVFDATPVSPADVLRQGDLAAPRRGWLKLAGAALPLAACVGLAIIGVRSWSTATHPAAAGARAHGPVASATTHRANAGGLSHNGVTCYDFTRFSDCFTGPGASDTSGDCACVDFDHDGDVDFSDFAQLQRATPDKTG